MVLLNLSSWTWINMHGGDKENKRLTFAFKKIIK